MKRKIAILLSAMMVTSAMPMTASAAQLKADGVLNTTFAKANETIDAEASKYTSYKTVDELKSRKSVVKVALNNDGTNNITGETTFKVQLENGTFDVNKPELYAYVNSNGTERVDYDKAMAGAEEASNPLKQVYTNISKIDTPATITPSSDLDVATASAKLEEVLKTLTKDDFHNSVGGNSSEQEAIKDQATFEAHPKIKESLDALRKTVIAEQSKVAPSLAHIPYKLTIDSPTSATVTVPNLNLSDDDKKIAMSDQKKLSESDITFDFGKTDTTSGKLNSSSDFNWTNLNPSGGSKLIDKIKVTVGSGNTENVNVEGPYIALPLGAVIVDGNAPVKVKIVSDYNDKVKGGEYTITTNVQEGNTALVYDKSNIKSFDEVANLAPVVIKENVRGTIGTVATKGDEVTLTLRLSGGFRFNKATTDKNIKFVNDRINQDLTVKDGKVEYTNDSTIRVTLTGLGVDRTLPTGIRVEGLAVEATNDKNYGDVELTISGDGITSTSTLVAKREQLGFKLETLTDAKEIVSGRYYANDTTNMTEANNTTVEVKFSEAVANTLVSSRALDFTVPEGVKIVNAEISKQTNFTDMPEAKEFTIVNNGQTLRIRGGYETKKDSAASFVMKFDLSIDPGFKGDIKLAVTGGGQSNAFETVIAKAVAPFEVKTNSTNINIGYQNYNTADIVITETKPGMFLEGKEAIIALAAPYGTQELGFSEAKFEVSGGELKVNERDFKIGDVKVGNDTVRGAIGFKVNKASYKNPSTITIKDVKIGTTRSVPFGAYDLKIGGEAVINNYKSDVKEDQTFVNGTKDPNLYNQNNTSSYVYKNYVNVITETGTFDQVVKVSVGEKTILLGDQAIDMDVAPYIQASSNSTMVPLRFVSVALGVDTANAANADESSKIAFDANTKTTTIYYGAGTGQKIIQFQAGSNIMTVDGTKIPMEFGVKAEIKDGRMFVPFRALGQALGVTVDWDADTRTAIYNKDNGRNAKVVETTTESTTASDTTTETTTESTTASDTTTETTTAKN